MTEVPSPTAPYKHWIRDRFPQLNQSIDDGNVSELTTLAEESLQACSAITQDAHTDQREQFTYISMMHSALYHHEKRFAQSGLSLPNSFHSSLTYVEHAMIDLAGSIEVEHRFLSVFYLSYNPEIPELTGKHAQFRPSEYETAFIRVNREGTVQYKLAANALLTAFEQLEDNSATLDTILPLLQIASTSFHKVSLGNAMLLKTPGGEEFKYLTQYFGEVIVAGKAFRGVNAGDQPWSYVIDLLLGVDLKQVFQKAFEGTPSERNYIANAKSSAEVIAYEFQSSTYLHQKYLLPEDYEFIMMVIRKLVDPPQSLVSLIPNAFTAEHQFQIAAQLHEVMKHYVAASNVHFQLAKRYVPPNATGEQIGSAGTNINRFLRDGLNAEREKVKDQLELAYPNVSQHRKATIEP
jgi:hypothetical protein